MEKIKRAIVLANKNKPIARQVKSKVEAYLCSRGVSVSAARPQLVVTVGGDGTVLFSKRYYGIPFFSIGSGTSFVCQADFSNWQRKLSRALAKPSLDRRLLLDCRLGGRHLPPTLNEIGIRNPEPRVISIHLQCGLRHFAFRADGVFFSTPTGSPAYAYSCGGVQMGKNSQDYQAVAISPFRRLFKPQIIKKGTACTLRISGHERAQLFIDGQPIGVFTEKNTLAVRAARKPFLFLKA
ncbi:MAG: hypothetical protein WCT52_06075 [Candidatus Micrarchaeia archaeon]